MRRRPLAVLAAIALAAVVAANAVVVAGGGGRLPGSRAADCALVLGAGVRDDGAPSDVLRDRLDEALALYRAGRVARIVVSGDHMTPDYDEPNAMRLYLEAHGVPPEAIFMDHAGFDTYSSVWRVRHVFGASRVVVVTQRFHLARAVWVARALGLEAEGSPADRRAYHGLAWLHAREIVSRTKAIVDVTFGRRPRHAGPRIDLRGDGRVTAG
ncbi:MAG: YdcF family protein [Labilithrix sp.]|nr:YdcF family protein [Labilithrix sp.]